jgi:hypothetical protein
MTLRQLWVRVKVILGDHDSPLVLSIRRTQEQAEEDEQISGMDDALALVSKRTEG